MLKKPETMLNVLATALSLAMVCVLLTLEVGAQTGAAREAFKGSAVFRDAVSETASSVRKYADQLDRTDRSLAELNRAGGDLGKRYRSFAKNLRKLENAQKNAASRIERLRARETEYFTAWDKANIQIADPDLRQAAGLRRSEVMTKYQLLADDLSSIGRDLQPVMSHLRDIDLFLGADPARTNLKEASAMIEDSRARIRSLKHEIASVQRKMKIFLNDSK